MFFGVPSGFGAIRETYSPFSSTVQSTSGMPIWQMRSPSSVHSQSMMERIRSIFTSSISGLKIEAVQ